MNQKDDGGQVYPQIYVAIAQGENVTLDATHPEDMPKGISLRDWFAGQALDRLSGPTNHSSDPRTWGWKMLSEAAYMAADAMLEARKQSEVTELQQLCCDIMEDHWGYLSVPIQTRIRQGAETKE